MDKRIKELRLSLKLTQQEFADRLGIKRNTIANYEIGRNTPVDSVICLICREYNVNESWLRTGEGAMLRDIPRDEELAAFFGSILSDGETDQEHELKKNLMHTLAKLTPEQWKLLSDIAAVWNKKNEGQK